MPNGVTPGMVFAVLIPMFVVTVALRALPFSLLKYLKGSEFMSVLGRTMPVGVMTVLVVYTWYGQLEMPGGSLSVAIAVAITLLLHLWRRDTGLSIVGGTVAYMILVNVVF